MGILDRLRTMAAGAINGRAKVDPLTAVNGEIAGIQAALAQAERERVTATAALQGFNARLDELLLADASPEEKGAHRATQQEAQDALRALELFDRAQRRRLAELEAERRRLALTGFRQRWQVEADKLLIMQRDTERQFRAVIAIVDEARAGGFEHEAMGAMPPPPMILGAPEIEAWADAIAVRRPTSPAMQPRPVAPVPAARLALPPPAPASQPPAPMRTRRTRTPAPVAGGVEVRVLRAGFETPDGIACDVGDIITLSPTMAHQAAMKGAVDYEQKGEAA